ncbi:nuclear pore complex protein Nup214 isoform X2 [Cynoglossus semilaevis]|uniref:nuclear pore complex protein Nup214 isoform X2 n=1 Tax=Cynoglossus semilaevis TaxID=244447 RepID=UPI000D627FFD|nr:nuclear pore complex protein Nup214 isoform X2 [Cynoglossus semilaevis]
MSDDTDSPPEREMKDFQFRHMKKVRVFQAPEDLPRERSNLLAISNKFGLTFVGLNNTFKVYRTVDILAADKVDGNPNEIVDGVSPVAEVTAELAVHHLALSCDDLTLSVCGVSEAAALSLTFYDVRTFLNKARPQKLPFASFRASVGTVVQDLKWNPAQASTVAVCLSDGSMMILDVTDSVKAQAQLPASSGITCLCWSPKGKQVAAGKMNATVSQYTPLLEEKKVIPCPHFYTSSPDEPVKALDVLWLKTFVFAVVYAAADGSLETPPDLVLISLPKKDEKVETKYLNFSDTVYGNCTERLHHYFLSHVEDWDLVFAASAASIEVSVIARQDDKTWELWVLEDASRAELPVTETSDDTLPLGVAIDFTSQQEIYITDEKTLPPAPTLLMLSTEGILCPFALLNLNPGVKQLVTQPGPLPLEGERTPKPGSLSTQPPKPPPSSFPTASSTFSNLGLMSTATSTVASSSAPFSFVNAAPVSSSSSAFAFSVPSTIATSATSAFSFGATSATPFGSGSLGSGALGSGALGSGALGSGALVSGALGSGALGSGALGSGSLGSGALGSGALGSGVLGSGSLGFSFASKPPSDTPSAPSAFSISTPSIKPPAVAPAASTLQSLVAASPPTVKLNLNERFSALETPPQAPQSFSFTPQLSKPLVSNTSSLTAPAPSATKPPAVLTPVCPVQASTPAPVQKPLAAAQSQVQAPQAPAPSTKAVEKQPQQKKESDHIMAGILEEIAHFQMELDDLKARSAKSDFKVGTSDEMKELRKESEDLHVFTLEIKETTESLHGDIGTLKTTLLEGFAGAEEAVAQSELSRDKNYRQLLYKKPLDPRSEERLKEIRRLYQYVTFAVEDVNDVLNVEWEKHLEKKKKLKHMVVPGRESLFNTLANNLYIINQQKTRLDQLVKELTSMLLYNNTAADTINDTAAATTACLESELESLRDSLLKARLDTTPPKAKSPSTVKITPAKQSQLRNFLSKGQMPPVRSTAPANLSRSAFLSPKYYEDLDDVSSTSSLSQSLEPNAAHLEMEEEEEELQSEPLPMTVLPPVLAVSRHPTVVRTPSIQPGFGAIQSTPLNKLQSVQGLGFGLSPIASPVPTNKINLSGADSTALATKTVKHGAPPNERTVPVTISAQQAAATAALRRQMANQKTAVSASLTESTLKTVPQVVNVQELSEKAPSAALSNVISPSVSDPAAQAFAAVSSAQTKRNPVQAVQTVSADTTAPQQTGFVFGQSSRSDVSVVSTTTTEQSSIKGFSFSTSGSSGFSFASVSQGSGVSQVKDVNKFSFSGNGKMVFGQTSEDTFSFAPKSTSPALRNGSPSLPPNQPGEAAKAASTTTALRVEPQPSKTIGGETLGCFSGLRVGQGEEAKDGASKPSAAAFTFGDSAFGVSKGATQFSFGAGVHKSAEDSSGPDLSKVSVSRSLFKPPENSTKPAFSVPQANSALSALPTSLSSLLAASSDSSEDPKAPSQPTQTTPLPEKVPAGEPSVETTTAASVKPVSAVAPESTESTAVKPTPAVVEAAPSPAPTLTTTTPAIDAPPPYVAPQETPNPPPVIAAPSVESTADATITTANLAIINHPVTTAASTFAVVPAAFQVPSSDKPGSIFTQPPPVTTDTSSIGVTSVITTVVTPATPTPTLTTTTTTGTVFGQSAAPPASSGPALTGFPSSGFGSTSGNAFGKPVFGQVSGFGQPAGNTATAGGFSFGQSGFSANPISTTTGGGAGAGGLFGAPTASNASSFSFGTSSANTASSPGTGLFGGSTSQGFGQNSGFGQGSVFGNNTTTSSSSSSGFSFGQPSAFGCSSATPVFGQQQSSGSVFGQPPSGGGVFGSGSANTASPSSSGFFSGLGGKPSEDAANKNPFSPTASAGAFGQPAQTGTNTLFGNSGAKAFGFGQSSFGEQKPSGTFSTGGVSVASQGFGSFSTPTKAAGFASAPVFGSPPAFGASPAFGGSATFGSSPTFPGQMGPSAGKVFGEGTAAANMGGFGFASPQATPSFGALANQGTSSFGGLAQQSPGFGSQPSSFSGFGQPPPQPQPQPQPQGGGFPTPTFGSSNQPQGPQTFSSWRS